VSVARDDDGLVPAFDPVDHLGVQDAWMNGRRIRKAVEQGL
jgi:hypothetical protein